MSPEEIDVKFHIFTYESPDDQIVLDYKFNAKQLKKSGFNRTHQTIVITHGFKSGISDWMIVTILMTLLSY